MPAARVETDGPVSHGEAYAEEEEVGRERRQPTMVQFFNRKVKSRRATVPAKDKVAAESSHGKAESHAHSELTEVISHDDHEAEEKGEKDDINQGAALLQSLFDSAPSSSNRQEVYSALVKPKSPKVDYPVLDHINWAWEPSCHEGLLTFHDGRKRWYHCTDCQYFNDRLYHSKMHYDRIHVRQGKSMPRKRKYLEPAGSKDGDGVALPPSCLKQQEPKYSRTRRPGDKWLKTMSTGDASETGFRYISVHDLEQTQQSEEPAANLPPNTPPSSDDGLPSPTEIEHRTKELGLSAREKRLYCWEPTENNISRAVQKGVLPKLYVPIYCFNEENDDSEPPSAHRPGSTSPIPISAATQEASTRGQRWWWHNPAPNGNGEGSKDSPVQSRGGGGDDDGEDDVSEDYAPVDSLGSIRCSATMIPLRPPVSSLPAWSTPPATTTSTVKPGVIIFSAAAGATASVFAKTAFNVRPGGVPPPAAANQDKKSGGNAAASARAVPEKKSTERSKAKNDGETKKKREWRRWDVEEERLLANAVTKLGTKDWSAIHEEMGTGRSIKQLQDHWNDTKNKPKM